MLDQPKSFTWSFSRLKNFETCPKRHHEVDILKNFAEEESEHLTWGSAVHEGMAARLGPKHVPLRGALSAYEHWAERIERNYDSYTVIKTEQKLAITEDFNPCGFFDKGVWFRTVIDVIKLQSQVALIADWKTGKILDDSQQLALAAAVVFAHYPEVQQIRSIFVWLRDDCQTQVDYSRSEIAGIWSNVWPRIERLKLAHDTNSYPAIPNRLCRKWCPVATCPHHGK